MTDYFSILYILNNKNRPFRAIPIRIVLVWYAEQSNRLLRFRYAEHWSLLFVAASNSTSSASFGTLNLPKHRLPTVRIETDDLETAESDRWRCSSLFHRMLSYRETSVGFFVWSLRFICCTSLSSVWVLNASASRSGCGLISLIMGSGISAPAVSFAGCI